MKYEASLPYFPVDEAVAIAADAYIYGFPLVLMDVTRQVMTAVPTPDEQKAPVNQFLHRRKFPDPAFTDVVSPNADTLYSSAWIDLSREPIILSVPDTNRYYVMQMLDAWTNVFTSLGTRTTGNSKGDFAIIGPEWRGKLPVGLKTILSPTRFFLLLGRTQTNGPGDFAAVHAIQDQYKLTPLSAWKSSEPYVAPARPFDAGADLTSAPVDQVMNMDANAFFTRLNVLMRDNAPAVADCAALERFASIGILPGRPYQLDNFEPGEATAIRKGVDNARARINYDSGKPQGQSVNGWDILTDHVGKFGANYSSRAIIAFVGLGSNLPEDAVYPRTMIDTQGRPLSGRHSYVIELPKDRIPPVNAFWSITAYNSKQLFIPNPINRYAIGDRDKLKFESDGSVVIYLSHASPGRDKESNWLPVGPDAFNLVARLYWPKPEVLNGRWRIPGVKRVNP